MDLSAYIKANSLMPERAIQEVTSSYLSHKSTFYEELVSNALHYGVTEKQVIDWAVMAGEGVVTEITATRGFHVRDADYEALGGVEACVKRKIICLREANNELFVLTMRPDDNSLVGTMNKVFGPLQYTLSICNKVRWDAIYHQHIDSLIIESQALQLSKKSAGMNQQVAQVEQSEARAIYNQILNYGIQRGASDIHIQPGDNHARVIYRIHGYNEERFHIPIQICDRIATLLTVDGAVSTKGEHLPVDGKVRYNPPNNTDPSRQVDLRFSLMYAQQGKDMNVRFLNNKKYSFSELGMSKKNVELFKELLSRPQGLIVQVGPTGSGKSTTLCTGLEYIKNTSTRTVITVEDPVEVKIDGITQISVNDAAGLTFAVAARQFLRHDVDVGVIGEIRDDETALEAVRIANTGHLVLSSLHTNDALGVIERLTRLGVDPYTLGEILVAIMGQRLVRRLCPHCRKKRLIPSHSPLVEKYRLPSNRDLELYEPGGCERCGNTGFVGRIAVNEILVADGNIRDMIQERARRSQIEAYLRKTEFESMYVDAVQKVVEGVTSLSEIEAMRADSLAFKV